MDEMQVCSKAVYDILVAFNNLSSLSEQEEVLDVIYDALYRKVFREVMSNTIISVQKAEIRDLKAENKDLQRMIQDKKAAMVELTQATSKKSLRKAKRDLLIIINNLKHYLGDSWQTVFPWGSENADKIIEQIDGEGIMRQDTWSSYEINIEDGCAEV